MHERFMEMALAEAEEALAADEFPVGCVIVEGGKVIGRGRRYNSKSGNELDHAEIVALRSLYENHPDAPRSDLIAYATMEPCLMCFSTLILNGVQTIVYAYEDAMGGGTTLPLGELKPLYSAKKVEVTGGVLRDKSLALFKRFFTEDTYGYWRNSLLAEYTLKQ